MENEILVLIIILLICSVLVGSFSLFCVSQPKWNQPPIFRDSIFIIILLNYGLLFIAFLLIGIYFSWMIAVIVGIVKLFFLDRIIMVVLSKIGIFR